MTYVARFGDEGSTDPALVGGKAASLGTLTRAGLPVPAGFAVTVATLRSLDVASGIVRSLDGRVAALRPGDVAGAAAVAEEAQRALARVALPGDVELALTAAYRRLAADLGDPHLPVAVRSSAVDEDGGGAFAGEYESVLWVRDVPGVLAAVRRCWASLWTARAVAHRAQRATPAAPAMGLAVQQMVRPRVAGVAFGLDPTTGDRSRVAIDAAWGLGGVVAAGEVTPDSWRVDRVLRAVTDRRIAVKTVEHRIGEDGGVVTATVEPARRSAPCLDDDEVLAVARLVEDVEAHLGTTQDVEWAVTEGGHAPEGLRLLQSRPETVWSRAGHAPATYADPVTDVGATLSAVSTTTAPLPRRPSIDDIAPDGAQGWADGYPRSMLFAAADREDDEQLFWFHDAVHWPDVVTPWEATLVEATIASLSDAADRRHVLPASRGVRVRVHHGYVYLSPIVIDDPEEIARRLPEFRRRARDHYEHWDELYAAWVADAVALVGRLEALDVSDDADDEALRAGYRTLLGLMGELTDHHFALLGLGYAAYLDFFAFCRKEFPGIPDLAVARMVSSADSDVMRPDRELRRLARLAVELGLADPWLSDDDADPDALAAALAATDSGRAWLAAWDEAAHPWFAMTSGSGFSHRHRSWSRDRREPYRLLRGYVRAARDGQDVTTAVDAVRTDNERVAREYAALVTDRAARAAFERKLALARTVFPLVENHSFYVEQWGHSAIWEAMRRLGAALVRRDVLDDPEDVFFLGSTEVEQALAGRVDGPRLRADVRRRADALDVLRAWSPPPALGTQVAEVSDPLMAMLWGVTPARTASWLHPPTDPGTFAGLAASPGVGEGPARVVHSPAQLAEVRDGEVLVAPVTSPGWAPVFGRVSAIVTDVGGVMSHAAIVCREFGLPAVTGTVDGTRRIVTGQWVRVDGTLGTVTLLDDPAEPDRRTPDPTGVTR